jgi:uncharacterized membrane protein YkvA (DUF1232 family)
MRDFVLITLACIAAAMLILIVLAAVLAWKVYRSDERRLARRIARMQFGDKLALGRSLFTDPRVPLWARFVAIALVVYLASPIDLIPDFIPVLGFLDDLLVVFVGAGLLLRAVSEDVLEDHVARYEQKRHEKSTQRHPHHPV